MERVDRGVGSYSPMPGLKSSSTLESGASIFTFLRLQFLPFIKVDILNLYGFVVGVSNGKEDLSAHD